MKVQNIPVLDSFQSSPAFTGGRFSRLVFSHTLVLMFQSSPAFTGGRFDVTIVTVQKHTGVSILARLYRRALHYRAGASG